MTTALSTYQLLQGWTSRRSSSFGAYSRTKRRSSRNKYSNAACSAAMNSCKHSSSTKLSFLKTQQPSKNSSRTYYQMTRAKTQTVGVFILVADTTNIYWATGLKPALLMRTTGCKVWSTSGPLTTTRRELCALISSKLMTVSYTPMTQPLAIWNAWLTTITRSLTPTNLHQNLIQI